MSVRSGSTLDGRYRLSERIAVGGMGEVWKGTDEVLGRNVAVKILRAELAEDDAFRRRFRAEARTAGGLPHNGIAAVFDYGETTVGPDGSSPSPNPVQGDGIAYLVMELVPGEALSSILSREGALGTERTLAIVAQAARALHAAHVRGVVHRDVKPANLMVTPEGRVKVTDFGIARPLDHEPLTMTGQVMGTAHYLAPELARGLDASPLSDVYALGVVAYECLAGHRPFDGDNQVLVATAHLSQQPPPLPGTIAPDVVRVVGAAMEKDPHERVPSAEAFAVALDKLRAGDPTALDGIGTGHGALSSAQAPAPSVPPAPPTRVTAAPPGAYGAAAAGGAAGAGARPWGPETAPQPVLLGNGPGNGQRGPGGPGGPGAGPGTRRNPNPGYGQQYGSGGYGPGGYGSDGGSGARNLSTPLVIGGAVVALLLVVLVLMYFLRGNSTPPGETPSTSPTAGQLNTGTATPTGIPSLTGTATKTASKSPSPTKSSPSRSATGSPSVTTSPTGSPTTTSARPSTTSAVPTTTAPSSLPPSSEPPSPSTPVASGSVSSPASAANLSVLGGKAGAAGGAAGAAGGAAP